MVNRYTLLSNGKQSVELNLAGIWDGHPIQVPEIRVRWIYIPWITVSYDQVKPEMVKNLNHASIIWVTTIITFFLVILSGALPPGFVEPGSGRFRFISDGFAQYRWIPFSCVVLMAIQVAMFWIFARSAVRHSSVASQCMDNIVVVCGLVSWFGLMSVASFTEGSTHYTGAVLFILFCILMHFFLDWIIAGIHKGTWKERVLEYGILVISALAGCLFALFMIIGHVVSSNNLISASAVAEYIVFTSFIAMNLYGVSMITYISLWYQEDPGNHHWVERTDIRKK